MARIEGRGFSPVVHELKTEVRRIGRPHIDDVVVKSGRTTGCTIGKVRRVDVVSKINYGGSVGAVLIGAFEIGPLDPSDESYEVSMGGDSGSAWLAATKDGAKWKPSDVMLGLHFAGESDGTSDEHALACYAHSVFEKLEITLDAPNADALADAVHPEGYDVDFIGTAIPLPEFSTTRAHDAVLFGGSKLIPYTHFSVCLSKSRRLAHFVGWNIDGEQLKAYGRKGLKFKVDDRIDAKYQVDNDLYAGNKLDRGHIARRADLIWGPKAEAQRANRDSFFSLFVEVGARLTRPSWC